MHTVCLLLGSNIRAEENLVQAVELLCTHLVVLKTSSVWESAAVGSDGPNFLNAALLAITPLGPATLKELVLRPLEGQLGRVRTCDKNAPRTIDIDLMVFDQQVQDPDLRKFAHIAVPVSQIMADLCLEGGACLRDVALALGQNTPLVFRGDVSLHPFTTAFQEHKDGRLRVGEHESGYP